LEVGSRIKVVGRGLATIDFSPPFVPPQLAHPGETVRTDLWRCPPELVEWWQQCAETWTISKRFAVTAIHRGERSTPWCVVSGASRTLRWNLTTKRAWIWANGLISPSM